MKTTKIVFIVAFMLSLCVFSGLVAALDQSSLSATSVFSKNAPNVGGQVTVRITVQNNANEALQITHVGVNFDWMDNGGFWGPDLSSSPASVPAGGSYTTPPFVVQVPTNVTVGSHTYFVGVDGTEGSNQADFYWNSSSTPIIIVPANATGTTTVPTTNPTGGGGNGTSSTSPLSLIIYGVVIAIVAVVIIALVVMFMQKRRKPKPSNEPPAAPTTPAAEQPKKPEEENYSI